MDSQAVSATTSNSKGLRCVVLAWRCTLVILFSIFAIFFLSALVGIVAVFFGSSSVTTPISLPSQCKIVSSSVDLRSSKVCELGLLNYKAKHVFYPFERSRFRCRYDYYWASVFKVEFKDQSSGQTRLAWAEAPNEALPLNCRPNFGAAWLTKDRFKVNETYDCWYTSGISKVSLYYDGLFSCQAKDPSNVEMIRRYSILSMKIFESWFSRERAAYWSWEMVAGVITGFSTSLITVSFVKLLGGLKSRLPLLYVVKILLRLSSTVFFKRTCFLLVYISVVSWLTFQYGKLLGFSEMFTVYRN